MAKKTRALRALLEEMVRIEGVRAALVVGRDGFVIETALLGDDLDMEGLGAVLATALGSSEVIGNDLAIGNLDAYLLEFGAGKVVAAATGEYVLALVAESSALVGSLRGAVMRGVKEIGKRL